ncbi:MAG: hypothetical protein IJU83_04165 [Clostridia bacterium]|nr:hypothetical protein [Clostridia bacterium]
MGGIKYSVHPLFFAVGFYYALTGRIFVFLIYTFTAVLHETGHSVVAGRAGYGLNKITLTPFGAVASGNIEGLKFYDELKIAAAGPLVNLCVGLFFVALWWIFPETYAFTDIAAEANFVMAAVNFIPVYPLDGGRIFFALLSLRFGRERAGIVCKITGAVVGTLLIGGFIYTLFYLPNPSLLFFGLFVFTGTFGREKENKYVRLNSVFDAENLKRGVPVKRTAVSKETTIKSLVKMLDAAAINEIYVYDGEKLLKKFSPKEVSRIITEGNLYSAVGNYV